MKILYWTPRNPISKVFSYFMNIFEPRGNFSWDAYGVHIGIEPIISEWSLLGSGWTHGWTRLQNGQIL